jgi:hypothetical protein
VSSPRKTYRIYCFDGVQRVVSADWLEAASDEEAIAKAEAAGFGSRCEIWDGRRLVASLGAEERRTA